MGAVPAISDENLNSILSTKPWPFMEKVKNLLVQLAEESDRLAKPLDLASPHLGPIVQSLNQGDVGFVARFLIDQAWLEELPEGQVRVTGNGFIKADDWNSSASSSMQGFVAMWFDKSTEEAWTGGLGPAITQAGYKPLRIDMKEHTNKICDEIISEIRHSRFLVADFTGHRGGVYYEAGYAAGCGIPVFMTCRNDQMSQLHFDIRQYNCIDWQAPKELGHRLKVRIERVLGDGPLKSR